MARRPQDRPDVKVFSEIGMIDQLVTNRLERVLPDGLSHAQFGVLTHFCHQGEVATPAELARAFQVTKGAMTNTLQRLEAQGFVAIEPDPQDGRRKLVAITPDGQAAHLAALHAMRPMTESLRSAFTEEEFVAALPFLKALRTWLDETR
ncbi:MAG: MarR family transcriptional regulator [Caulobacteraceae bacterium]|nr:MarR family transcriptional regulator [Caulobacteraceae bacterium]